MSRRSGTGILLFNSKVTCARCPGSRRRFNVGLAKHGFHDDVDDDRILIENLYTFLKLTVQKTY